MIALQALRTKVKVDESKAFLRSWGSNTQRTDQSIGALVKYMCKLPGRLMSCTLWLISKRIWQSCYLYQTGARNKMHICALSSKITRFERKQIRYEAGKDPRLLPSYSAHPATAAFTVPRSPCCSIAHCLSRSLVRFLRISFDVLANPA